MEESPVRGLSPAPPIEGEEGSISFGEIEAAFGISGVAVRPGGGEGGCGAGTAEDREDIEGAREEPGIVRSPDVRVGQSLKDRGIGQCGRREEVNFRRVCRHCARTACPLQVAATCCGLRGEAFSWARMSPASLLSRRNTFPS